MPYVITTTDTRLHADDPTAEFQPGAKPVQTRRAVATLGEAQDTTCQMVLAAHAATGQSFNRQWEGWAATELYVDESGGTVGPLPDGTVIKVEPTVNEFGRPDVRGYLRGWHFPASMDDAEILDAYNAAQEAN